MRPQRPEAQGRRCPREGEVPAAGGWMLSPASPGCCPLCPESSGFRQEGAFSSLFDVIQSLQLGYLWPHKPGTMGRQLVSQAPGRPSPIHHSLISRFLIAEPLPFVLLSRAPVQNSEEIRSHRSRQLPHSRVYTQTVSWFPRATPRRERD